MKDFCHFPSAKITSTSTRKSQGNVKEVGRNSFVFLFYQLFSDISIIFTVDQSSKEKWAIYYDFQSSQPTHKIRMMNRKNVEMFSGLSLSYYFHYIILSSWLGRWSVAFRYFYWIQFQTSWASAVVDKMSENEDNLMLKFDFKLIIIRHTLNHISKMIKGF